MVEQMLAGLGPGPAVPLLGDVKSLLVDHRTLGALAGRARERLVNRFLARRLSAMLASCLFCSVSATLPTGISSSSCWPCHAHDSLAGPGLEACC